MFGNLQSRLFPAYFALQSAGSLAMLTLWAGAYKAPVIKTQGSTANLYLIAGMAVAAVGNLVAVGPWTTGESPLSSWESGELMVGAGIMKRRHRLERLEGTTYDATDVEVCIPSSSSWYMLTREIQRSPKMKELNTAFAYAHSVSSLLNLGLVIAGAAHTMWLAQYGSAL